MADCTIVSLYPGRLEETKPGLIPNTFVIEGPKKAGEFTVTHVTDVKSLTDPIGGRAGMFIPVLAEELAQSLVYDFLLSKIGSDDNQGPGLFWVKGTWTKEDIAKKFPELLSIHKKRQEQWFLDQILVADTDWARKRSHLVITQDAKWAAEWLGQEREWLMSIDKITQVTSQTCKGCASVIPAAAIVCSQCRTIQDEAKYKGLKVAV